MAAERPDVSERERWLARQEGSRVVSVRFLPILDALPLDLVPDPSLCDAYAGLLPRSRRTRDSLSDGSGLVSRNPAESGPGMQKSGCEFGNCDFIATFALRFLRILGPDGGIGRRVGLKHQ